MSQHVCRWKTHRGCRWCSFCGKRQYTVAQGVWRDSMSLGAFANKWLPAVSGPNPVDLLRVDVAFPFEWNSYESWNVVWQVRFTLGNVLNRTVAGLGTRVDVMDGWQSKYHEDFCRIDYDAEQFYLAQTNRPFGIGDNCYDSMRKIIQHGTEEP